MINIQKLWGHGVVALTSEEWCPAQGGQRLRWETRNWFFKCWENKLESMLFPGEVSPWAIDSKKKQKPEQEITLETVRPFSLQFYTASCSVPTLADPCRERLAKHRGGL